MIVNKMGNNSSTRSKKQEINDGQQTICQIFDEEFGGNRNNYFKSPRVCPQDSTFLGLAGITQNSLPDYFVKYQVSILSGDTCSTSIQSDIDNYALQYVCPEGYTPCEYNNLASSVLLTGTNEQVTPYNPPTVNGICPPNFKQIESGHDCTPVCQRDPNSGITVCNDGQQCYTLNKACIPKQPDVNYDNLNVNNPNPDLLSKAMDCCIGNTPIIPGKTGYVDSPCGIGLCDGGARCGAIVQKYCTGQNVVKDQRCIQYLKKQSGSSLGTADQDVKQSLIESFLKAVPNEAPETNPFTRDIFEIGTNSTITNNDKGKFYDYLPTFCQNVQSSYPELFKNPNDEVTQLCGCYLEPSKYPFPFVQRQCEPICIYSQFNNPNETCNQNYCAIDINFSNVIIGPSSEIIIEKFCKTNISKPTGKFTIDAYNNIVTSKNTDTTKYFGGCDLIDENGNQIEVISCPKSGETPIFNCKSNIDCKSKGMVCQNNICVQQDTPSTFNETTIIIIVSIIFVIIIILILFFVFRK